MASETFQRYQGKGYCLHKKTDPQLRLLNKLVSSDAVSVFCTDFNLVTLLRGIICILLGCLKGIVLHEFYMKLRIHFVKGQIGGRIFEIGRKLLNWFCS